MIFMPEFLIYIVPVLITMLGTLFVTYRNIQNNNISSSRIKWLAQLKENFAKYNENLSEIKELMNEDVVKNAGLVKENRKRLEKSRINVLMSFKANDFEAYGNDKGIKECFEAFSSEKEMMKKPDDCEAHMFIFMNAINRYIIEQVNTSEKEEAIEQIKKDEIIINENTINVIVEIMEQFQLCVAKMEWTKIKNESQFLLFGKEKYSSQETIKVLNTNIYKLVDNYIEEQRPEEELKEETVVEKTNMTPLEQEAIIILENFKSVPDKLINILEFLDRNCELPTSMLTSTKKRYIYSMIEPVHPSGKQFFSKKEFILPKSKKRVYLETNFSLYYGDKIAMRMVRMTEKHMESLQNDREELENDSVLIS